MLVGQKFTKNKDLVFSSWKYFQAVLTLSGASLAQYLQAIAMREEEALQSLEPPKQIALLCGPKLYQPDTNRKLTAIGWYKQILDALLPKDPAISAPRLWHNDLHDDNIFIDPKDPENITAIVDWQSCHLSPLFNHNPDPGFLGWDGLEPETLDLVPKPDLSGLSPEERAAALHSYSTTNVFIGWRMLMQKKNPDLYRAVEFRNTPALGLIFLAHRMFEYGEAIFLTILVDLQHSWAELPAVQPGTPFPFKFSEADVERIKSDGEGAVAGTEVISTAREEMGDLWPDKGLIEHERYDECRAALKEIKKQLLDQLAKSEEEREAYERHWPFE